MAIIEGEPLALPTGPRAAACTSARARVNGGNAEKGAAMSIDIDTARKVAKLARIRVEEADLPALAGELSGVR